MSEATNDGALNVPPVPVEDLANRYVPQNGWVPLLGAVADRAAKNWSEFEISPRVQALRTAINDLRRATASPTALKEKWEEIYRKRLHIALRDFRGMVREAFVVREANANLRLEAEAKYEETKAQARVDLDKLEERQAAAQQKLDLEIIGLGGVKECQIHAPEKESAGKKALWWAAEGALILITLAVELVIGQEAIASRTDPLVARVLVGALAIFTFIVIHVGMKALRGFIAYLGAKWRFNKAKKAGEQPENARLFPYPATQKVSALVSVAILAGIVIGLLQQRLSIAEEAVGSIASGSSGDATSAFGLVAIIAISAAFVFSRQHDHTDAQYAEVDRLRAELLSATTAVKAKRDELAEMEQPRIFEPVDTFQDDIAKAKAYYNETMDEEEKRIQNEAAQLETQRSNIFGQWAYYQMAYPLYDAVAIEAMNTLVGLVEDYEHNEGNDLPTAPTAEDSKKARGLLAEKAKRTLGGSDGDNDQFVKSVVMVSFPVSFPFNEKLTDFEGIVEDVRAELEAPDEVVTAPEPAPAPTPEVVVEKAPEPRKRGRAGVI